MQDFICRVCGHDQYRPHSEIASMYQCDSCSAIFADPQRFTVPNVKFVRLSDQAQVPRKMLTDDAGYDLMAAHDAVIAPGTVGLIKTDIAIQLPPHHEAQVRSRSGIARSGIFVANSPGTIDAQFRGNLGILLFNSTEEDFRVNKKDRVAQLVIDTAIHFSLEEVSALNETERATGGFGHTGR